MNSKRVLLTYLFITILTGCASLQLEQPQVSVIGFRPISSTGLSATFMLDLRIANPNAIALPVKGMSYEFAINDTGLMQGVSNNIGNIPPYGTKNVSVEISTSLLSAPKILYSLLKDPVQEVRYRLTTKLNLSGALPTLKVVEDGKLTTTNP